MAYSRLLLLMIDLMTNYLGTNLETAFLQNDLMKSYLMTDLITSYLGTNLQTFFVETGQVESYLKTGPRTINLKFKLKSINLPRMYLSNS